MRTYVEGYTARLVYGYEKDEQGRVYVDEDKAKVVQLIFDRYLAGTSISGLVKYLAEQYIPSPTGKPKWAVKKVDDTLRELKYVPQIISPKQFGEALDERNRRSSYDYDDEMNKRRKATRYHSGNVLSGLFVCGDCGASYRRITQSSGEVVWRCANRVEHGKRICPDATTLKEVDLIDYLCAVIGTESFDAEAIREQVDSIIVGHDDTFTPNLKQQQTLVF